MSTIARTPRYDGLAEWYDDAFDWYPTAEDGPGLEVRALLGGGAAFVLDVGCGSGLSALALADAGWTVGGVDESADQLAIASNRCSWVVRADATALPSLTAASPTPPSS